MPHAPQEKSHESSVNFKNTIINTLFFDERHASKSTIFLLSEEVVTGQVGAGVRVSISGVCLRETHIFGFYFFGQGLQPNLHCSQANFSLQTVGSAQQPAGGNAHESSVNLVATPNQRIQKRKCGFLGGKYHRTAKNPFKKQKMMHFEEYFCSIK